MMGADEACELPFPLTAVTRVSVVSIEPCNQKCIATGKRPIFQLIINGCVQFFFSDSVKGVQFPEN